MVEVREERKEGKTKRSIGGNAETQGWERLDLLLLKFRFAYITEALVIDARFSLMAEMEIEMDWLLEHQQCRNCDVYVENVGSEVRTRLLGVDEQPSFRNVENWKRVEYSFR